MLHYIHVFFKHITFIRDEGDNYPNGLTKPPWARWWHGASWQRRDVGAAPVTLTPNGREIGLQSSDFDKTSGDRIGRSRRSSW